LTKNSYLIKSLNENDYFTGFNYFYDTPFDDVFISDGISSNYFSTTYGNDYIEAYNLRIDFS